MEKNKLGRVLFVDDEPNLLDAMRRKLRRKFDVATAEKGAAGLVTARMEGPFAVVVSDLRMPGMDGIAFLSRIREMAPDTVRMLLSGNADLESATEAVNKGSIFRLLQKPCPDGELIAAVEAGVEQHRLITAEKVLLEETLHGSVKTLAEVLALANPAAFGRGLQAKQYVAKILDQIDEPIARWPIEVAAMLSQIGCITLPPETTEKLCVGEALSDEEQQMVDRLPAIAEELLGNIPRLEPVREILSCLNQDFGGGQSGSGQVDGTAIPFGSRLVRLLLDFEALRNGGASPSQAFEALGSREGVYDPKLLELFVGALGPGGHGEEAIEIKLSELKSGMIFADEVRASSGMAIVARGQEVTPSLITRLANFRRNTGVVEPLKVVLPEAG